MIFESAPFRCGFFLCKRNLNRVAKRTPTEQGGKGGKDAAGRERRRLERAGRKVANGRRGSSPGVGFDFF